MRSILFVALSLIATEAAAACYGSDSYQTCYDTESGNTYNIQRFGNNTMMQGSNSRTGATWSQNSYSFGNSTMHQGQDSRGRSWSQTCIGDTCY